MKRTDTRLTRIRLREMINGFEGGLCISEEDGWPILINSVMTRIVSLFMGESMINTSVLWDWLETNGIRIIENRNYRVMLPDHSVWSFYRETMDTSRGFIIQITAFDDTEIHMLQRRAKLENDILIQQNERQREMLVSIVENNRQKELLAMKMNIHGALGNCVTATNAFLDSSRGKTDRSAEMPADEASILQMWENALNNVENLQFGMPEDETDAAQKAESELQKAAGMIGCHIHFPEKHPKRKSARVLYYAAIREALTNAVRHNKATQLEIETYPPGPDGITTVRITDNGGREIHGIQEGTGLSNLRRRLEDEDIAMRIVCDGRAALYIDFHEEDFLYDKRPDS